VVFHEITRDAVEQAFRHPRDIDIQLVDAQQARRVLDRLVGYKISPILWRKVMKGLSAGRVQSVAVRMVVDREREIEGFIPVEYWSIEAELKKNGDGFRAKLEGSSRDKKLTIRSGEEAGEIVTDLRGARYTVSRVQRKTVPRDPVAPFITSTLQQEAWRKLHFSAKRTMAVAQALYEGVDISEGEPIGLITYMRTDSTNVAAPAVTEAREYIAGKYGPEYLPAAPRIFKKKVKGAQEAHEAIRPTSVTREPQAIKSYLTSEQYKLYDLIWKRMVASQMAAARFDNTTVDVEAVSASQKYVLRAISAPLSFSGFLMVYREGKDEEEEAEDRIVLPELTEGDALDLADLFPEQHFTKPPSRYTEATLIKALEENGIGRPSTYAPILSTIQDRDYVVKEKGQLRPNEMGFVVTDLLAEHFPDIVSPDFTARMEEKLDEISSGGVKWVPVLKAFYDDFAPLVEKAYENMPRVKPAAEPSDETCEKCGSPMVIKRGRFGKFLACSNFPACRNSKPIQTRIEADCPKCGGKLVEKRTRKKKTFYGCGNYPQCDFAVWERPLDVPCPECGSLLVPNKTGTVARCAKCDYSGNVEELSEKKTVKA